MSERKRVSEEIEEACMRHYERTGREPVAVSLSAEDMLRLKQEMYGMSRDTTDQLQTVMDSLSPLGWRVETYQEMKRRQRENMFEGKHGACIMNIMTTAGQVQVLQHPGAGPIRALDSLPPAW